MGVVVLLTAPERVAVRDSIAAKLKQLDNVHAALATCDELTARRLLRTHRDYLRLLDDLGWAAHDPRPWFAITMPADALGRTLMQLAEHDPVVAAVCAALVERLP